MKLIKQVLEEKDDKFFFKSSSLDDLLLLKWKLMFLEMCGYDVKKGLSYIDYGIGKLTKQNLTIHKQKLIHNRGLPLTCLEECDFNCLDCNRNDLG